MDSVIYVPISMYNAIIPRQSKRCDLIRMIEEFSTTNILRELCKENSILEFNAIDSIKCSNENLLIIKLNIDSKDNIIYPLKINKSIANMFNYLIDNCSRVVLQLSNIKLLELEEDKKIQFWNTDYMKNFIKNYTIDYVYYEDLTIPLRNNRKIMKKGKYYICKEYLDFIQNESEIITSKDKNMEEV